MGWHMRVRAARHATPHDVAARLSWLPGPPPPCNPPAAPHLPYTPLPTCPLQAALDRWVGLTSRVPLVGWASMRAVEILEGVQRYYSYVERMA